MNCTGTSGSSDMVPKGQGLKVHISNYYNLQTVSYIYIASYIAANSYVTWLAPSGFTLWQASKQCSSSWNISSLMITYK